MMCFRRWWAAREQDGIRCEDYPYSNWDNMQGTGSLFCVCLSDASPTACYSYPVVLVESTEVATPQPQGCPGGRPRQAASAPAITKVLLRFFLPCHCRHEYSAVYGSAASFFVLVLTCGLPPHRDSQENAVRMSVGQADFGQQIRSYILHPYRVRVYLFSLFR